jgi:hypothetical protein
VIIVKWLFLPLVDGDPHKPDCVAKKDRKTKVITWESSPRNDSDGNWPDIIALVDARSKSIDSQPKQNQKITQLDTSSKRHSEGHGGRRVRQRVVLVQMDAQTFDSWIRFQEVVDENEDDDTKAAAVVTQLLHPWSEVSLPRLFCGISGKYSVPSCVRPRNRDTRSSELLRVTPIVGTSDYSCASLIQNSCVAGRPNTTAEDVAIRADDSFD